MPDFPSTWTGALGAATLGVQQQQANTQERSVGNNFNIAQEGLKLQQQQQQNQQQRELFARADKERTNLMTVTSETIEALKLHGVDTATIAKQIQPLVQAAKRLAKSSGTDDTAIDAQVAATLAAPANAKTQAELGKPTKMGQSPDTGADVYGSFDPKAGKYKTNNLTDQNVISQTVEDAHLPGTGQQPAGAGQVQTTDRAKARDAMAETYFQTGQYPPGLRGQKSQAIRDHLVARAMELHPEIPVSEWPKRQQEFKSQQVAISRFMSGPQGNTARSLGVVVDHFDTVRELGTALKNGNIQLFNQAAQTWAEQTGLPAPTNFDMVKMIVGTELIKGLGVVGAGTKEEREELGRRMSRASSPAQLLGVINDVAQPLLGGQLRGLRNQFIVSTGLKPDKFDQIVGKRAAQFLAPKSNQADSPAPSPGPSGTSGGIKWSIEP